MVFHEYGRNQIFTPDIVIPSFKSERCCNNEIATLPLVARNDKSFNVNKNNVTMNLFQGLSIGFSKIQSCINQIDRFRNKFGMTNLTKRCAFTLSELLLALIIVGVLAVFTIPVIVNHIQTRIFVTKLKNTVAEIEQVAKQELIRHHTRDLSNTDFADPELLLSDKHFAIIKKCSASNSQKDCWKTAATGKNKVTYKTYTRSLITLGEKTTIILKNSIALSYTLDSNDGKTIGNFTFDINGSQKPNILGKDYFGFYITPKGNIIDIASLKNQKSLSAMKKNCSTGFHVGHWCYSFLISNNYKMNY